MQSNTPYSDTEQNLAFYARASDIASQYQEFRIKYIKYKFISRYNTFQATTNETTAFPIPLLYMRIDKSGALPTNTNLLNLKQMGCKPVRFTKNLNISWAPGVVIGTNNDNNTAILATKPLISPWLMTNKAEAAGWAANDTDHKGLYWFMETAGLPGDGTYSYDAEVEVGFEFRKPLSSTPPAEGSVPTVRVSTLRKGVSTSTGTIVPPA